MRTQPSHFDLVDPEPEPTESVVPVADDTLIRRDELEEDGGGDSEAGEAEASESPSASLCLASDRRRVEKMSKMLWRFGVSSLESARKYQYPEEKLGV